MPETYPALSMTPILLRSSSLNEVSDLGVTYVDALGAIGFASFAECQANVALLLPRLGAESVPLVGFKDASAPEPWVELAARPALRFLFQPGQVVRTSPGGRFGVRQPAEGFREFIAAVGECGFAFGDLA